jgi:hypothetical protein
MAYYPVFIGFRATEDDAAKLAHLMRETGCDKSTVLRQLVRDAPLAEDGEAEAEVEVATVR